MLLDGKLAGRLDRDHGAKLRFTSLSDKHTSGATGPATLDIVVSAASVLARPIMMCDRRAYAFVVVSVAKACFTERAAKAAAPSWFAIPAAATQVHALGRFNFGCTWDTKGLQSPLVMLNGALPAI